MSKTNRIKLSSPTLKTRLDLDRALGEIRQTTIARNQLVASRDLAHKSIDDKFGPGIDEENQYLQMLTEQVKAWADANEDEFAGKRSLETTHGTIGWRLGQWQCDKLTGWIWARTKKSAKAAKVVLEKIKELAATKDFVRTKEEVDKDALIAARGTLTAEQLSAIGVKLFQEEAFFIDPKIEDTENRQSTAA